MQKKPKKSPRAMAAAHRVFLCMEQGPREEQQDSAAVFERNGCLLAVVCDGAGGHRGGQEASRAAVETAKLAFEKSDGVFREPRKSLEEICSEADRKIRALGESPKLAPKSTIAMVYVAGGGANWVHLGDSRIYRLQAGRIKERSRDHSMVQILFEKGEVPEEEMGVHPDQGRLLRALGAGEDCKATHGSAPVKEGDGFLICTDGFWERTKAWEIEDFFRQGPNAGELEKMVKEAVLRNGPKGDNTTALAVLVGRQGRNLLLETLLAVCALLSGCIAGLAVFPFVRDVLGLPELLSKLWAGK